MREINIVQRKISGKYPKIQKQGIISSNGGEMSVFVFKGRLMRLENFWGGFNGTPGPCAAVCDYVTGEFFSPVGGDGSRFYQSYCVNDRVYVFATAENCVYRYESGDLVNWEKKLVLEMPENFMLYNTAVCRGDGKYMMAIECGYRDGADGNRLENEHIGTPFTEFFAESADLKNWNLLPPEKSYSKERYIACPALEYHDGYYYMICLEAFPAWRFAPYIYRTQDFETWEIGFYNPVLVPSEEDLHPKAGVVLTQKELEKNFSHLNTNNSDVDICEFEGKTYILYCSGNQGVTWGGMYCEALFDGPMDKFLTSFFE